MIRAAVAAAALGLAATAPLAQDADPAAPQAATPEGFASAGGAYLRGLDKVAGVPSDITLTVGQSVAFGSLAVTLTDCRYPADDPASNAFAFLDITDTALGKQVFRGWMIAANPAISALDHQRYDVWVLRCKID